MRILISLALVAGSAIAAGGQLPGAAYVTRGPRFLLEAKPALVVVDIGRSPALRHRVSLDARGQTLGDALNLLSKQSGLRLAYTNVTIPLDRPVELRAEGLTVAAILTELLGDLDVDVLFSPDGRAALVRRSEIEKRALVPVPAAVVSGRVTDQGTGQGVPSAQVLVERTSLGATTNERGEYTIRGLAAGEHRLTARRVGYAPLTKTVTVTDQGTAQLDFALQKSATQLAEVVTTVTGGQARYEIGNAIAQVRADSIVKERPITNLSDLLANRVPGAFINGQNGLTGTVSPIRLRGINSFTVSNNPIVIVDGTRIESTTTGQGTGGNVVGSARLGDLNVNEVESIEVVKGPSAATLYGTDAANGVVIVKTKHGQISALRWDASGEGGWFKEPTDRIPVNYRGWGHSPTTGALVPTCTLASVAAGTCVQDSITKFSPLTSDQTTLLAPGNRQGAVLQGSGGSRQFRYFFSGGWESELGFLRMPEVEQTRILSTQGLTEVPDWQVRPNDQNKVNVRGNVAADFGDRGGVTFSNGLIRQSFRQLFLSSFLPFWAGVTGTGYDDSVFHGYGFGILTGDYFQVKAADQVTRYITSLTGNYRPADWLSGRATLGYDFSNDVIDNLQLNGQGPAGSARTGQRTLGNNNISQYTVDAGATATKSLTSALSSKTSLGVQYNRRAQLYGSSTGTGLPPGSETISGAATLTTSEIHADAIVVGSYVEQEFGWRDRLFATAGVRTDGASTFGQNLHTAAYPKLSFSWLVSEEPSIPKIPGVGSLRIRAAVGSSGVQPPSTASVTTVSLVGGSINGTAMSGVTPGAFGNPKVGPERQTELEGGFDLDAWNGRAHMELTGYSRKSTDALVQVPIAPSGGGGSTYQNIGSVSNKGLEGLLTIRPLDRTNVAFDLTLNGSANTNKLLSTGPGAAPGYFQNFGATANRHRVGYPLYGLWQKPILSYADQNNDGIIVPTEIVVGDTEVYVGPTAPTKQLAASGTLSLWRDAIRVAATMDWHGGFQKLDYGQWYSCALIPSCPGSVIRGDSTLAQQASTQAYTRYSSQQGFMSNGAYTRLREVSISARLPAAALKGIRARGGSLMLMGRNVKMWTNWPGLDPEVNYYTGTDQTFSPPVPTFAPTFIVRLNLSY